jgi:DNA-binding SARP family transcriptional activator
VDARQRELNERLVDALETHARAALALGGTELPVAERIARRLKEEDPLRDSGYVLLIEAQHAAGNRRAALSTYEALLKKLREVGTPPDRAILGLYDRISELD